jgi:hypothetical protein
MSEGNIMKSIAALLLGFLVVAGAYAQNHATIEKYNDGPHIAGKDKITVTFSLEGDGHPVVLPKGETVSVTFQRKNAAGEQIESPLRGQISGLQAIPDEQPYGKNTYKVSVPIPQFVAAGDYSLSGLQLLVGGIWVDLHVEDTKETFRVDNPDAENIIKLAHTNVTDVQYGK